jgi:oxygen-independent coproporphyrinogen-3 oxidase
MIISKTEPELGLYLHLPHCPYRCPYCDFYAKVFDPKESKILDQALFQHIELVKNYKPDRLLDTVYFGGGTPTMRPAGFLSRLLKAVSQVLGIRPGAEISLEANPGTLSPSKLKALRQAGFNRLSLGAQTFCPELLASLGRSHTQDQIWQCFKEARRAGFDNINLDLIYGLPGQTTEIFERDLAIALELKCDHLSLYELTLAPETPFGKRYTKDQPPLPVMSDILTMEAKAREMLPKGGLMRYEVSNYAVAGKKCRHNQSTWRGGYYLALGPGAHGHLKGRRFCNNPKITEYQKSIAAQKESFLFEEHLSLSEQALERIMLGLRTLEGVNMQALARLIKKDPLKEYQGALNEIMLKNWAFLKGDYLIPTSKGLDMADSAAALFLDQAKD